MPGLWLNEGGQSAAGSAIAHLLTSHPASARASGLADKPNLSLPDFLVTEASHRSRSFSQAITLAGQVIVVPDFLGNRSPLADPNMRAIISGLGFEQDLESLIALYVAGISGLGYGLRQIIEAQRAQGVQTNTIVISGGAGQSQLVHQLLADASGVAIAEPGSPEPVLLGAAMLGAVSGGTFGAIQEAMNEMSSVDEILHPVSGKLAKRHNQRFKVFCDLQKAARI